MRLEWVGTMGPRLVTETLARCGLALTGWLALNEAGEGAFGRGAGMTTTGGSRASSEGSETRVEACWTAPPRGVVVVTAQVGEPWSELLAVDPVTFRERLEPGVADPPEGIVVDLTSSPREVVRALRPLGDLFARVTTVAIVRDPGGASEAMLLGVAATVRCESDVATAARTAASICRTLSGRPQHSALEEAHRRLQQVHAQQVARSADAGARQAMIVHDLRSPLSVVRGVVSELLEGTPLSPDDRKLVDLMDHASAQLEALIERLEQLYACASESQRLERIDLAALARGVADGLGRSAVARGKPIHVHASAVQMVYGDRQDLVRVVANLLGNALRHTRTHVELRVEGDEREVRLSVADDGPGVAPPVRSQIFQGVVRNPTAGRMGLGLAIVHSALERHKGRVSVHDRAERDGPGQEGACFVVRLPRGD